MQSQFGHPLIRWLAALAWTALTTALMLLPGDEPLVHNLSDIFGGTELTDAIGHVVLFAVLVTLWRRALTDFVSQARIMLMPVGAALIFGTGTELYQALVPDRGLALIDLLANWLGVLIAWAYYRRALQSRSKRSPS